MRFMWHIETDYFALAVFLIMYIKEFSMRRTRRQRKIKGIIGNGDRQGEAFFFVLFFSVVSTVIDIVSSSAMNNCGSWWIYQSLMTIPYIVYVLIAASNPFTGLFFKLSSNMEYERGVFFYACWSRLYYALFWCWAFSCAFRLEKACVAS